MKNNKNRYILAVLGVFASGQGLFAMSPSGKVVAALRSCLHQFSSKAHYGLAGTLDGFNKINARSENEFIELCSHGASLVKEFDIPVADQKELTERLRSFGKRPFFFIKKDPSTTLMGIRERKDYISFSMSPRAIKYFYENNDLVKAILEHEYCHLKNEDSQTCYLFDVIHEVYGGCFSDEELAKVKFFFGEDYLSRKDRVAARIIAEANAAGIDDFKSIADFNFDAQVYTRFQEERADEAIFNCNNTQWIKAFRDNEKDCLRYGFLPEKLYYLDKRIEIQEAKRRNGGLIPSGFIDFDQATPNQTAEAADRALRRASVSAFFLKMNQLLGRKL